MTCLARFQLLISRCRCVYLSQNIHEAYDRICRGEIDLEEYRKILKEEKKILHYAMILTKVPNKKSK